MRFSGRLRWSLLAVLLVLLLPSGAAAKTCSSYPNQAAAQEAADTIDADGDGLYCEALPCPCSTGGGGGSERPPARATPRVSEEARRKRIERATWRVTSVVDGDTIRVKHTRARVYRTLRLIGIDTPETHKPGVPVECGGRRATRHMQGMAFPNGRKGRRVKLQTDRSQDLTDRYGRLLVYVRTLSGRDLNKAQVLAGLADTYVYGGVPFERFPQYDEARRVAKKTGRGVWKLCGGNFHSEQ